MGAWALAENQQDIALAKKGCLPAIFSEKIFGAIFEVWPVNPRPV